MADLSQLRVAQFPLRASPDDLVSPHFTFYELTKSELAARLGIDNSFPGVKEARAAVFLCCNVMEPIRDRFGPYSPNSVFRGQALERALKKKRSDWISKSWARRATSRFLTCPTRSLRGGSSTTSSSIR